MYEGVKINSTRGIVPFVVQQHAEDAAVLHRTRSVLASAPHIKLHHLRRFDDRLAAHLDGLSVAGEGGWPLLEAALETPSSGAMFAAAVQAIEGRSIERLDRLFTLAAAANEASPGLRSAFGWLEPTALHGLVAEFLTSTEPLRRMVGTAASAMHRVDPGLISRGLLDDPDPAVRARALRTAGELGKRELVSRLARSIDDEDAACQFWAAWSAVILGDRQRSLEFLSALSVQESPFRDRAFLLTLLAPPLPRAREMLQKLASDPAQARAVIRAAGLVGDPTYIPWLISLMSDDKLARLAGESFSMIAGLDLAWLDLERKPPENFESGPNDNPEDESVAMDEDDGLPWPDQVRIQKWWESNGQRFTQHQRHFIGAAVSRSHCVSVLKQGYQRQRIAAALHLCLLEPGTPLFEWRAPAWRQQQELARL